MQHFFAPMEGLTDSIYRRLHHRYFPGIDRYYMAFISPTMHHSMTAKEKRDLPPAESEGFLAVPQILTKVPEDFLWAANVCHDLGYKEINLNMGCPSGTVVSKGKGAGMLADPDALAVFLDEIYARSPVEISLKTRLGVKDPEEFPRLLEILNRYPVKELIVHPRVRADFYNKPIRREYFQYAMEHSKAPLCYNGNLYSKEDIGKTAAEYEGLDAVMLGRALIANPGMLCPGGTDRNTLMAFHGELLEEYRRVFGSDRNAMFRLKEGWGYMLCLFEDAEKLGKALRKTTRMDEYISITTEILRNCPMRKALEPNW